jgi:hypothetical protein
MGVEGESSKARLCGAAKPVRGATGAARLKGLK